MTCKTLIRFFLCATSLCSMPSTIWADGLTCGPPRLNLGVGPDPVIEIFSEANFESNDGHMLRKNAPMIIIGQACRYIGDDDNDVASSVKVLSGTWRLYEDAGYQGRYIQLSPGEYPNLKDQNFNDILSSFEPVAKSTPAVFFAPRGAVQHNNPIARTTTGRAANVNTVQNISSTTDINGNVRPGSAAISGPASITCLNASGQNPSTYPPSCSISAPGYYGSVNRGQTVGTSGAGTVTLTCNGQVPLSCSARIF